MWRTTQLQCVETQIEPDDDTSLYRLFGFSLFVSIRFRKRAIFGRLRKQYTITKRAIFRTQLRALTALLETDKSGLPACIRFQDRGKMRFPRRSMLPFCRHTSLAVKTHLNSNNYSRQGRKIARVTKQAVLGNEELHQEFKMLLAYQMGGVVDNKLSLALYRELVSRVINTMLNSFFQTQDLLQRIADNKGVDAQISLRDKLKAYVNDTHSKLSL